MDIRNISWEQTIPLWQSVLWPTKTAEYCHVEGDDDALHFGAFVNGELVCVASVYLDLDKARLRKFATLGSFQGQGIGSQVITHILKGLQPLGVERFWCDARSSAVGFYQQFGLAPFGEEFFKSGVPYYKMEVRLI